MGSGQARSMSVGFRIRPSECNQGQTQPRVCLGRAMAEQDWGHEASGPWPDTSTAVLQLEAGTPAMQPRQRLRPMGRGCGPQVRPVRVRPVSALSALSGLGKNSTGIYAAIL